MKRVSCLLAVLICALVPIETVRPQNSGYENLAILRKGPIPGKGVPNIFLNAIPYDYALYEYRTMSVEVYFTGESVVPSESWTPLLCGRYRLLKTPVTAGLSFFYGAEAGWSLFILFSDEMMEPCPFIEVFIRRLIYFMGVSGEKGVAPFPAILDVRG